MDCSTSSIVGLFSPATVADGASNVTGTSGATGYAGTVTLSCGAGTGQISASSSCGCDTPSGYSPSGGVCISNCNYTVTGGSPSAGTVSVEPVSILAILQTIILRLHLLQLALVALRLPGHVLVQLDMFILVEIVIPATRGMVICQVEEELLSLINPVKSLHQIVRATRQTPQQLQTK